MQQTLCLHSILLLVFGFSCEQESMSSAAFQFIPVCIGCSLPPWQWEEISLPREREREIYSTWWHEERLWRWLFYSPVLKSLSCPDVRKKLLGIWRGPCARGSQRKSLENLPSILFQKHRKCHSKNWIRICQRQIITLALFFPLWAFSPVPVFLFHTMMCVYFSLGSFFWLKSLFILLHSGLSGPHMLRPWCVCARRVPLLCGLGRLWVWESTGILHGPMLRSRSLPGGDRHLQLWP